MANITFETIKELFLEQISGIYFSDVLFILIIAAFFSIIPGYVLRIKRGISGKRIIHIFLTIAYAGIILLITIFRREIGSKSQRIYSDINLGMSSGGVYSGRQLIYSLLNVALFIPWGVLISGYRMKQSPIRIVIMTTLIGFITSFSIEFFQLITGTGRFEVTDLFTNVLGSFLGAFFVCIYLKVRGIKEDE